MRDTCVACAAPLVGADDERCAHCAAQARACEPGGFVALLDGRPVRAFGADHPYEFVSQHAAEYVMRICYPGLAARVRILQARVVARGLRQGRKGDSGLRCRT